MLWERCLVQVILALACQQVRLLAQMQMSWALNPVGINTIKARSITINTNRIQGVNVSACTLVVMSSLFFYKDFTNFSSCVTCIFGIVLLYCVYICQL